MTVLISNDEKQSLELLRAVAVELKDGGMVIISTSTEIEQAEQWMTTHGLYGVAFGPTDPVHEYSEFKIVKGVRNHENPTAIELYN